MDKIAFFLPTRKGSERVKNKNTRPFAGMDGGLIENKIRQLLGTKLIDEIILSTNDEKCMEVYKYHSNITQKRHGASRNYRYVLDVSTSPSLIPARPRVGK